MRPGSQLKVSVCRVTAFAVRILLGAALLWSGLAKINRPYDFLGVVYSYRLVGPDTGFVVAMWLPWLELTTAIALLAGIFTRASFVLSCVLGVLYVYVEASALHRALPISCGCFSMSPANGGTISYATLSIAALFLVGATTGYICTLPGGTEPGKNPKHTESQSTETIAIAPASG
jgi:uncharacterized membrane protein YphA (DoxX/SURF4 family)